MIDCFICCQFCNWRIFFSNMQFKSTTLHTLRVTQIISKVKHNTAVPLRYRRNYCSVSSDVHLHNARLLWKLQKVQICYAFYKDHTVSSTRHDLTMRMPDYIGLPPPSCRSSPTFDWYSLRLPMKGWPDWVGRKFNTDSPNTVPPSVRPSIRLSVRMSICSFWSVLLIV